MNIPVESIKHPFAHLTKNNDCATIWWEDAEGDIHFFDDLPCNYPRFTVGTFDSREEAISRYKDMVKNEGWEVIEVNID